jgi:glycosyltransferase involved in cell wall biosynthesis
MRLVGLVKGTAHVCCRYRLAAFEPWLAAHGHQLELRAWPSTWLSGLWFHRQLRHFDVAIVLRRLLPAWQLSLLRRSVKKLVFDFDDAVFQRDSYADHGPASSSREAGFARMVGAADAIVAGNAYLAERAVACGAGDKVHVVPTCVDPDRYSLARHERTGPGLQLAWIGSASTMQGLEQSRFLWDRVGRRLPGIVLRLICDQPLSLRFLQVNFRPWSEATEAADLASADIGISWLPDDAWSQGKCGLKVLQYMAAGLPVVANPVGVQAQMIQHGVTGFLADTPDEWCEAIAKLAADPALRRRLGQSGREALERDYSVAAGAGRWQTLLEHLAGVDVGTEVVTQ